MRTISDTDELKSRIRAFRNDHPDGTVGFVPTMGYLHRGHESLIQAARSRSGLCVVSIYVNPTQFGPNEDLDRYPRDESRDKAICERLGVDILFLPQSLYHPNHLTVVSVPELSDSLCGKYRPGHFDGVCTIVTKLFNLVRPDQAFFGQKDFQQAAIIRRMTRDLDFGIDIILGETIREADGLAMSSRNVNLSPKARHIAPVIHKGLLAAGELADSGEKNIRNILNAGRWVIEKYPEIIIQYLECRDAENLTPMEHLDRPAVIAIAAFLDSVRLIDNIVIHPVEV